MFLKRILITATLASFLGVAALAQSVSLKLAGVTVKEAMEQLKDVSGLENPERSDPVRPS